MTPHPDAPQSDHAAYVRALIAARCPEIDLADLAMLQDQHPAPRPSDPDTGIPVEIAARILDVLGHLMDRMERLEGLAAR
jgi:hypothetical protein